MAGRGSADSSSYRTPGPDGRVGPCEAGGSTLSVYAMVIAEINFSEARKIGRGIWKSSKFQFTKEGIRNRNTEKGVVRRGGPISGGGAGASSQRENNIVGKQKK